MKKIFLTSIAALAISVPAFADTVTPNIAVGTNPASCTESVLETTSGTSNLEAAWTPNTLNIDWYNGETKLTSNTCTYDSGITVPSTNPTKTGYTFAGWTVKTAVAPSQPQQTSFDLSTLFGPNDICENAEYDSTHTRWKPISVNGYTMLSYLGEENSSDLNSGEWAITFSYGTVKGQALCSSTNGYWGTTGTPNETGGGQYCWCKATNYTPLNGSEQNVSSSSWVFYYYDGGSVDDCAGYCAFNCANLVRDYGDFRGAMFGVAGADMCVGGSN